MGLPPRLVGGYGEALRGWWGKSAVELKFMGIWQEMAMDYLMFYPGPPCPTLLSPETALRLFQGWPASRAGGLWPSFTPLDRHPMPYGYGVEQGWFWARVQGGKGSGIGRAGKASFFFGRESRWVRKEADMGIGGG
jgi:hypothetical protein